MKLTKKQRIEVYENASPAAGDCYVCGEHTDPLGDWHVAKLREEKLTDEAPSPLILVCDECHRRKGSHTLEGFRLELTADLKLAESLLDHYGSLPAMEDRFVFAGERLRPRSAPPITPAEAEELRRHLIDLPAKTDETAVAVGLEPEPATP